MLVCITFKRLSIVPFEEDEKDPSVWFIDHNYHEAMYDMFKKVNGNCACLTKIAKEKMIGWYHSGPKLRPSDLQINELFKKYTSHPVLVVIDVQPKDLGIPTDAYYAIEELHDVCFLMLTSRMAPQQHAPLVTFLLRLKLKNLKKLAWNIC